MHLAYFDENKYSKDDPYFYIGGIILKEKNIIGLEKTLGQIQFNFFGTSILSKDTEMHSKEIFHGKGAFKKRKLADRIQLLNDITDFVVDNHISIRIVSIDVHAHRKKYRYAQPEYQLGLMLILERFCDYLDKHDDLGLVFGDYEKDEITQAVLDFSQFKFTGRTPMYSGRPLGRLIDTIYFTHSHHSRFLQVADIIIFLANRFETISSEPKKWHERKGWEFWKSLKGETDFRIQKWP